MSDISFMWYRTSVREELIEKILEELPRSARKEREVERYAHEYVYGLKLEYVRPGNDELVKRGVKEVYMRISQNKNK